MNQFCPASVARCFHVAVVLLAAASVQAADQDVEQQQAAALTAYVGQEHMCELYRASGGDKPRWMSNSLTDAAMAPRAAGDPGSYVLKHTKTFPVIYRGSDGQVHELYRTEKADWTHGNLTALAKAPLAGSDSIGYVKENDNTQHVLFRTTAGDICELYRAAANERPIWFANNLTAETKSP